MTFACVSEDFHPYECDGPGACRHCDRTLEEHHDPQMCELCADTPRAVLEDWDEAWR